MKIQKKKKQWTKAKNYIKLNVSYFPLISAIID